MSIPIITLMTDFGWQDSYVAQMKGVILSQVPQAQLVDITHEIAPQNVAQGAFVLAEATRPFPPGSIHVAVVDPGVGTNRDVICVTARQQHFILPDNGLITHVIADHEATQIVVIEPQRFVHRVISQTFHGRDIMAPAAAFLAAGHTSQELGPATDHFVRFELPPPHCGTRHGSASILHIDHFGNVITNLSARERAIPAHLAKVNLSTPQHQFELIPTTTYGAAFTGELILLEGSHGFWEIATVNGSAVESLNLKHGDRVEFQW